MAGNNVVHPAELERELQARLARAQERRPGRAPSAPASGPRRRTKLASVVVAAALAMIASLAVAAGHIIIGSSVVQIDEAIYRGYNPGTASGSGVFDAFVQIGGNNTVTQGYNTDHAPQFDEGNSATHNHSYRLSNVPTIFDPTLNTITREFQLDVNQNTGNNITLDEVEVYLTDCRFITAYPFEDWAAPLDPLTQCLNQSTTYSLADLVYQLDKVGEDAGGNNWLELDDDISAGSGKRDLILRIPQANFLASPLGQSPACAFQGGPPAGATCTTFVTLYSHFGGDEDPPLGNTDGFEEWGVELYDLATKAGTKFNDLDGDGVKDVGEPGLPGWTIYVDYNGNSVLDAGEPSAVTAANGTYTINAIVPGTYRVREVAQPDWVCTFPNPCYHEETFLAGSHLTGNNFGNFQLIDKTGSKYVDDEGDGSLSGDSKYTAGWTINLYKDDGDGVPDAGDTKTSTTTNATGDYAFNNLGPGTYFACEATATPTGSRPSPTRSAVR